MRAGEARGRKGKVFSWQPGYVNKSSSFPWIRAPGQVVLRHVSRVRGLGALLLTSAQRIGTRSAVLPAALRGGGGIGQLSHAATGRRRSTGSINVNRGIEAKSLISSVLQESAASGERSVQMSYLQYPHLLYRQG